MKNYEQTRMILKLSKMSVNKHTVFLVAGCFSLHFIQAQNIGIGTSAPTRAKLEVSGVAGAGSTNAMFGSGSSGITLQQNWPTIGFNQYRDNTSGNGRYMSNGFAAIQYFDPNTGLWYFDTFNSGTANTLTNNGSRVMRLGNNGTEATLYVQRNNNFNGAAELKGSVYSSLFNAYSSEDTYIRGGKGGSRVIINDVAGSNVMIGEHLASYNKVGININPTVWVLDIAHSFAGAGLRLISPDWGYTHWELKNMNYNSDPLNPESTLALVHGTTSFSGSLKGWFGPSGSYTQNSDVRLKKNITALYPVLDKLMTVSARQYQFRDSRSGRTDIGFIAQDLLRVFPEVVDVLPARPGEIHPDKLNDQMGVRYGELSVIALKAIQEQQVIIQQLKEEIASLKKQMATTRK
jgi:Chaperone of endosialidase